MPLFRHQGAGELAELIDDLCFAGEILFAAARRIANLVLDRAVAEMDFDADLVPMRRAKRGDRRIMDDAHLARKFDPGAIFDAVWRELVDKSVAGENQRGGAERQIQLRGGQPLRSIWPAGMIDGDLRRTHDNFLNVRRGERMPFADIGQRVQGRMITADAGVEFQ